MVPEPITMMNGVVVDMSQNQRYTKLLSHSRKKDASGSPVLQIQKNLLGSNNLSEDIPLGCSRLLEVMRKRILKGNQPGEEEDTGV